MIDSSTGADLADVSADNRARHAQRFVGFDAVDAAALVVDDDDAVDHDDIEHALTHVFYFVIFVYFKVIHCVLI